MPLLGISRFFFQAFLVFLGFDNCNIITTVIVFLHIFLFQSQRWGGQGNHLAAVRSNDSLKLWLHSLPSNALNQGIETILLVLPSQDHL